MTLEPIFVISSDDPAPITIGGKPYYPGPSFNISYEVPAHIIVKPIDLKLGRVGLVNLAEFTIKIRDIDNNINSYKAQLSRDEINSAILDAKTWLEIYALDFESSKEIEFYIEILESALNILDNAENSLSNLQIEANNKFDNLLKNNIVRLSNFKDFKDSKPWLISAAYESNIAHFGSTRMRQEYIRLWRENIEIPQSKILIEKQKIEATLSKLLDINDILNKRIEYLKQKELQTNAEYISTFFEHISEKYGLLAEKEAKKLADSVKGKKIRNIDEAIKALDKYNKNFNKKINKKDREAILKALESLDMKSISNDLYNFNKVFKYTGTVFSVASLIEKIKEGYESDNWTPFYIEVEKQLLDKAATYVVGLALVTLTGASLGIIGYGILMVVISALISDELVEELHNLFIE
ncbi:hypothetical protein A6A20_02605 [Volucribacter amazonae]|uniref:Channel forming colicins domain-containing protein n=2 Tax=Volucribacter amazonae TaxID=256731 RepID=A0A9X4SJW1_9PAST|nr:hypothetical protein [Volucribacter amazonae]